MNTRILLADDHRLLRDGLRALLEAAPGVQVVGEAEDGRSAVRLAGELSPDVVVMDLNMPDLDGIEATRQIRASGKGPKVVALSGHTNRRFATEMFEAGASAYVLKESAFEELAVALRAVAAGRTYLSPAVAGGLVEGYVRGGVGAAIPPASSSLTPREREMLQLIAEGKATKEVARQLRVSVKTVETHRRNIMDKAGLSGVAEMTRYAIREGITSADG